MARKAVVAPSLGRNLATGPDGTVRVNLVEPGTMSGVRSYQLDIRLAKSVKVGQARIQGTVDF